MPRDGAALRNAIRVAAERAFSAVRDANPGEHFYYFALVTTGDALRPGPSASSAEGLERTLHEYRQDGERLTSADLRWSEADSPYNLYGDEHFAEVSALFLQDGDHRQLPQASFEAEVRCRYEAMEAALMSLDGAGFFGTEGDRHRVVINVVAPGDEDESVTLRRAARLNPPEALSQLRADFGDA